jgi:hypothetical protein
MNPGVRKMCSDLPVPKTLGATLWGHLHIKRGISANPMNGYART